MKPQRMPFPGKLEKNLLEYVTQGGSLELFNCYLDKAQAIHKRPGLFFSQQLNVVGGVQAMYYWAAKSRMVVVAGGKVYASSGLNSTLTSVSGTLRLLELGPAKIVDTGYWLYICSSSGKMVQWNGTDQAIHVADGAAPINVSSITYLNQRVIANELGTNRFWYTSPPSLTAPTDALVWSGYLEYGRTGEDNIGVAAVNGELVVFKRDQFMSFFDDGSTPYKPITGSQHFHGLMSARAMELFDDALFFVSPDKEIRVISNREVRSASDGDLNRELSKLRNATDAVVLRLDRHMLFTFPNEERTFTFDPILGVWGQFSTFSSGSNKAFLARCSERLPTVGDTDSWVIGAEDSKVYYYDAGAYTDAGEPIRVMVRTPHNSWGTSYRKHTARLVMKVSTDQLRDPELFSLELPDAMRCVLYYEQLTLPEGVVISLSGLPSTFSYAQADNVLTISGTVTDFVGTKNVVVTVRDDRGAQYSFDRTLVISDYDIEMGVL
jgi:hypothetical protein